MDEIERALFIADGRPPCAGKETRETPCEKVERTAKLVREMDKTIIFDIDGTLTNYNKFVDHYAVPYFERKYGLRTCDKTALEIEDVLAIKDYFLAKGCPLPEAEKKAGSALKRFWSSPYALMFAPFGKFRENAAKIIRYYREKGYSVEIHTTRGGNIQSGFAAKALRLCTKIQFLLNGVQIRGLRFYYYANDEDKIAGIINAQPECVFEDKPKIFSALSEKGIKTFCVSGRHNIQFPLPKFCERIDGFGTE